MHIKVLITLFTLYTLSIQAQDKVALKYAALLDSTHMKTILSRLASEEFAGRKSSEEGGIMACEYLIEQLNKYELKKGVRDSYKQNIEAFVRKNSDKYFQLDNFNYSNYYDFNNTAFQDSVIEGTDIVFAGFGIYHPTYNDFANIDIKDKIVLIMDGDGPINKYGIKCHNATKIPDKEYLKSQQPKAIINIREGFRTYSNYSSKKTIFNASNESTEIPSLRINEFLANKILEPVNKSLKQLKYESEKNCSSSSFEIQKEIKFKGSYSFKYADINNIVAIVEGADLKDEYVVVSAHYDHIGKTYRGDVYFGADDNASGVSVVMEIARVLNKAKKAGKGPRRSVVILLTTAEEDGLHGSEFYVRKPVYPLEKTIACVNIDMLGRIGSEVNMDTIQNGYITALTGRGKINEPLFNITDSINKAFTKMSIISKEKSSFGSYYSRSDHYSFHKKDIPSVFFTNGSHEDLHKTTDTEDKIDYKVMLQRSKLVFLTVWDLANKKDPINK